jgi:hypothetical protein
MQIDDLKDRLDGITETAYKAGILSGLFFGAILPVFPATHHGVGVRVIAGICIVALTILAGWAFFGRSRCRSGGK